MRIPGSLTNLQFFHPDPPGGGAPAAAPPPAPAPAPAAPEVPAPAAAPPPAPGGTGTPPPAGGPPPAPTRFEYDNDRSDWLSPAAHRQALEQANREAARLRSIAEAAAGFRIPEPEAPLDPRVVQARNQLEQIYPGIGRLMQASQWMLNAFGPLMQDQNFDPRLFSRLPDMASSVDMTWSRHSASVLDPVYASVAQAMSLDALTDRQRNAVTRDFIAWIDQDRTGQREARYNRADKTLTDEYISDYQSAFIHPLQRIPGAPAGIPPAPRPAASLPPAPRGGGPAAPPAPAPAPANLDEATDRVWQGFRQAQQGV